MALSQEEMIMEYIMVVGIVGAMLNCALLCFIARDMKPTDYVFVGYLGALGWFSALLFAISSILK